MFRAFYIVAIAVGLLGLAAFVGSALNKNLAAAVIGLIMIFVARPIWRTGDRVRDLNKIGNSKQGFEIVPSRQPARESGSAHTTPEDSAETARRDEDGPQR